MIEVKKKEKGSRLHTSFTKKHKDPNIVPDECDIQTKDALTCMIQKNESYNMTWFRSAV